MANTEAKVDAPSASHQEMCERWRLLHDLLGGTRAMRAAGETWLPKHTKENVQFWQARINRSFLLPAFSDAITRIGSRPFAKPVTINGELPPALAAIEKNADNAATNLSQFARAMLDDAITYGLTHVMVDLPNVGYGSQTREAEATGEVRPYFCHVKANDLIAAYQTNMTSGATKPAQIRIHECRTGRMGRFGAAEVEYIRVYELTGDGTSAQFQLWKKSAGEAEFSAVSDPVPISYPGIPIATLYLTRTGFMTAVPPLEDLAWVNLQHWQSASEQREILRLARCTLLFGSGMTDEEIERGLALGPGAILLTRGENSRLGYVEHTGQAIGAGRQDLIDLQEQMEILSVQPLLQRTGSITATGKAIDEAKAQSSIQSWIRSLEGTLRDAFTIAAAWMKMTLPPQFSVDVNNDFVFSLRSTEDIVNLIATRRAREISRVTFLDEMRRRGLLSDSVIVADEIDRLSAEGPSAAEIGAFGAVTFGAKPNAPAIGPNGMR